MLYLTVHAEQIGTEAVDDSTVPEKNAEMERCREQKETPEP
ncbi:MAG: hypothetical protein ACLSGI_04355 [Butyricicoccaceae bacterium]